MDSSGSSSTFQIRGTHTYQINTGGVETIRVTVSDVTDPHAKQVNSPALLGSPSQQLLAQALKSVFPSSSPTFSTTITGKFGGAAGNAADAATIARTIVSDQLFVEQRVRDIYKEYLGRDPGHDTVQTINGVDTPVIVFDDAGAIGWIHFLAQVGNETQMRALIIGSDEYFNRAQSIMLPGGQTGDAAEKFITSLYHDVLGGVVVDTTKTGLIVAPGTGALKNVDLVTSGRALDLNADKVAKNSWAQLIRSGQASRTNVALMILQSNEGLLRLVAQEYARFLQRNIDAGAAVWVTGVNIPEVKDASGKVVQAAVKIVGLRNGASINETIIGILTSKEFTDKILGGGLC